MAEIVSGHRGEDVVYDEPLRCSRRNHRKLSNCGPRHRGLISGDVGSSRLLHRSVLRGARECDPDHSTLKTKYLRSEKKTHHLNSPVTARHSRIIPQERMWSSLPIMIVAGLCLVAALVTQALKETHGEVLPDKLKRAKAPMECVSRLGRAKSLGTTLKSSTILIRRFLQGQTAKRTFLNLDHLPNRPSIEAPSEVVMCFRNKTTYLDFQKSCKSACCAWLLGSDEDVSAQGVC